MPTTYNGVGTHYYGKRNHDSRRGVCPHCGREANLENYDTRLWFVIVFIPIIPLGHKRIINACSLCSRHQVAELGSWETAKHLSISDAMEKFHRNSTPEAAVLLHQQLMGFQQLKEADEFAEIISKKFSDQASVQVYLGAAMDHLGRLQAATVYYQRALQLRADLPEARVGVALQNIRDNRLEEARKLLAFLELPGAEQLYSLGPLERLANAFQSARRHDEALELFSKVLVAFPHAAQLKGFRKKIKVSEKALGRRESMLPHKKFSWKTFVGGDSAPGDPAPKTTLKGLAVAGGVVLCLFGILALCNEYVRRHRTLHIVNATGVPASISIEGQAPLRVGAKVSSLVLPEGHYRATIDGAVSETIEFDLRADYIDRWSDDPAWVINVGGAALLLREQVVYATKAPPSSQSWSFGAPFVAMTGVTHPFRPLPPTLQLKSGESRVLTSLEIFSGAPMDALWFIGKSDQATALRLAEWQLARHPEDETTLHYYAGLCLRKHLETRAEAFLKEGLAKRPVAIEWHRMYQSMHREASYAARMAAEYEVMLAAEPNNSALLYLRGRMGNGKADEKQWFERALAADEANPYPHFALGYDRMTAGDWNAAQPLLARALELKPAYELFEQTEWSNRFALGRYSELKAQARKALKKQPLDFTANQRLYEILLMEQLPEEAKAVWQAYEHAARAKKAPELQQAATAFRRGYLYAAGEFATLQQDCATDKSPEGRAWLACAMVEQGHIADAKRLQPLDAADRTDPVHFLTTSLAWHEAGDEAASTQWLERGLQLLDASNANDLLVAAALRSPTPPPLAELTALTIEPQEKAILLALLAARHPSKRLEFNRESRRFNVNLQYPHHLLLRATAPSQP